MAARGGELSYLKALSATLYVDARTGQELRQTVTQWAKAFDIKIDPSNALSEQALGELQALLLA